MKNLAIKTGLVSSLAFVSIFQIGCSPVEFSGMQSNSPIATSLNPETPTATGVVPPISVIETPVTPNAPILSKGTCAPDSSTKLLSCMNCVVPHLPPSVPQFSKKGEALFEIMTAGCQVRNGSDPAGYAPPPRAELLRRLNRLSPTLYPDSPMTNIQVSTISSLMTDPAALKKMFGGIFYSGVNATTTAFETYFGIETIEARYAFCYAGGTSGSDEGTSATFNRFNSTPMLSKAYIDCTYSRDPASCQEGTDYITSNTYRRQLRNAMNESISHPYVAPTAGAQQTCAWEKFQGKTGNLANQQVKIWLAGGFTIGGDIPSQKMCAQITQPLAGILNDTPITMAAYRCH